MHDLLGGKGAGLAEMTRQGFPVPPGFTITTEACLKYYELGGKMPPGLIEGVRDAMHELEKRTQKGFGDPSNPLLVSVRSGARVSMPGMMDTILDLGLNDETVSGLAKLTNNEQFAQDSYHRLKTMFDHIVGKPLPSAPYEQLDLAIASVFDSWHSKRAIDYRRFHRIPDDWGTAVNIVAMVFGNLGDDSGTGVAFTRDPNTGDPVLFGEYLINAQGEDVVAGIRTPQKIEDLRRSQPAIYAQLEEIAHKLERHYGDMQDLEFTVERGKLYMLQTRSGKRSAEAAVKIALSLEEEGIIDGRRAVGLVEATSLDHLFHARIDPAQKYEVAGKGLNASPGAAAGRIVFDADDAAVRGERGEDVILVRTETTPDDVHGMIAARGVLTAHGGATSHAAVVARGMGKPCVAGLEALRIDERAKTMALNGTVLKEGDEITIDGTTGAVILKRLQLVAPPSTPPPWLAEFLSRADRHSRLAVWANADTVEDARRARELGATGIGLTRTEHMFMQPERLPIMQEMIMAADTSAREAALRRLQPFQREDFKGILRAMAGYTVTIRLLDPPLHEFLPSLEQLLVETTRLEVMKGENDPEYRRKLELLERVRQLHEQNPMLGLRVCRLGIMYPEIYAMQVRAIFEAAIELKREGVDARPDVMIPGVGTPEEMRICGDAVRKIADEMLRLAGITLEYHVGTMIELPRSCVIANELAEIAEFFSFGTNDLTQTTFGYSRDDAEATFIPRYLELRVLKEDPFQVLDRRGVGKLMKQAVKKGRKSRKRLKIGICGEHGGDPSSVAFCDEIGLDYVSCSPYRVPIARLAAAQAALQR
ncbi:MAG: pyruvate, phosphate dikinase [Candidatus Eremiobacteraeota bacterium]|nr:pyruvate, phosphate dikinase [Candidatus Eremiobacteraeota bacterium]